MMMMNLTHKKINVMNASGLAMNMNAIWKDKLIGEILNCQTNW